jgi:tungstate transport system substrate-binding protein
MLIVRSNVRRVLAATVAMAAAFVGVAASTSAAHAADRVVLTIAGTSDVSDSNLMASVIEPRFEAAYPGIDLQYVGQATGAAISQAESGQASALIVHAASLENQFVSQGFSLEPYGRAIFWGDFVLLGPANDPAGVLTNASHNIVQAFEDIAAASAQGKASFVSRGGTPGTTVQEHAIWALTNGVPLCNVPDASGGGATPSSATGACVKPSSGSQLTTSAPSWYYATGSKQGQNVQGADACPTATFANGGCYVFTDRGTYDYLASIKALSSLKLVTKDNDPSAPGGTTALVNSFHAYAVNPAKFAGNSAVTIQSAAATTFLNWITSPAAQAAVGNYLASGADGAPFLPSAAPTISTSSFPKSVIGGKTLTVNGSLKNVVPGTPALSGVTVNLNSAPTVAPTAASVIAHATTDANGNFSISYKPTANRTYWVTADQITKIENASLSPQFGDILAPSTTAKSAPVAVVGTPIVKKITGEMGKVTATVALAPAVHIKNGTLEIWAGRKITATKFSGLHRVAKLTVKNGSAGKTLSVKLNKGQWHVQFRYVNKNVVTTGKSAVKTVTIK